MRLDIMTFNLRNSGADDGSNSWPYRKDAALSVISGHHPAILGIQEGLPDQVEYLDSRLQGYIRVGRGREADGSGEYAALYMDSASFSIAESGDFWLSDTPQVPGSITWGHHCVRIATWAVLNRTGEDIGSPRILVVNTHLDHESDTARIKGAELIMDFVRRKGIGMRIIVMGDMNAEPGNAAIDTFLRNPSIGKGLADTLAFEGVGERPKTFHGFNDEGISSIDYIFVSPDVGIAECRVITDTPGNRWPSDHYPVIARVEA